MSLAEDTPRLDVLRALRLVDFDVVKAVMLLRLVCETPTLQGVVMNALLPDACSEEDQAKLESLVSETEGYADRVDASRALRVINNTYDAEMLLALVYHESIPEDDLEEDMLEPVDEEFQADIKRVISLAGNAGNLLDWHAMLALNVFDDVKKAAMLLALIRSQGPASHDRNTAQ